MQMGHAQPAKVKVRLRGLQRCFVAFAGTDYVTVPAFARDMTGGDNLAGPNYDTAAFAHGLAANVNHIHPNHKRRDTCKNPRFGCLLGSTRYTGPEQSNDKGV
jgi:hypothetical protein